MATYEAQSTGIKGETDIVVRTGIAVVPAGWQNMTAEKAAERNWLVGRISFDKGQYRVTSYAQQTFQREDWEKNTSGAFRSYDEAFAWIVSECNNVLERL